MSIDRIQLLARILVLVYSINAFSFLDADTDLWGHVKFGGAIWAEKSIPDADPYSFTAQGHRWINHEWLTEVLFFLVFSALGSPGLVLFKLLLGLSIVHALSVYYFKGKTHSGVFILHFLILTPVLAYGFAVRPQIITFAFITLLVLALNAFFDGSRKALWCLPPAMLVWANSHGGVAAGMAILGAVTAVEWIRKIKTGKGEAWPLAICFGFSLAAVMINPYGWRLWLFFLETIPRSREITEWQGIALFDGSFLSFKILCLLFIASLFTKGNKPPWEITVVVLAIVFGFRHERHTVIAGIVMTPYLLRHMTELVLKFSPENFESYPARTKLMVFAIMTGFILIQASSHFMKFKSADFQIRVDPRQYPVYAVRFMNENEIQGNVLTPFDWGEYLIWKLPRSKVSIDGRFWTVYPNDVFLENLIFNNGSSGWEYVPDLFPTDIILSDRKNPYIDSLSGWIKIYEDPTASIMIRDSAPPSPTLEKFRANQLIINELAPPWTFP